MAAPAIDPTAPGKDFRRDSRDAFRLFRTVATPYVLKRIAGATSIVVLTSLVGSLAPVLVKLLIDSIAEGGVQGASWVLLIAGAYIFSQWLSRALGGVQGYVNAQADRRVYRALSDRLFDHVMRMPLQFHLDRKSGAVSEILSNGLVGFQLVQQTMLGMLLPTFVQLATVITVLVALDQSMLMIMFIIALGFYGAAFWHGAKRSSETAKTASSAQIDARAIMMDGVMNAETVKYFTAEQAIRERLDTVLRRSEVEWLGFFRVRMWNGLLVATIFSMFLAVNILYAVWQVLEGRMSIGTFVLVNTYIFQIVAPVEMVGGAMQALAQGMAFLGKMLELFRGQPESMTAKAGQEVQSFSLRFEDVRVSYKNDHPILKGVSFEVPAGRTLGVVGTSGAGKSTLVRLLVRFIEPSHGRILVDGRPITDLSLMELRRSIAVVPQDTVLFDDTISYNIAFGRLGATQEEVVEAARLAQLHDSIIKMPDGYDTKVGERGLKLSGGEKQRVSIARAAVKRPRMYIFDEATSSLDSRTEQDILQNIRAISRDSTTLIIAHRLSTVVHADNIIVLDGGRILEQGTHDQLLAMDGHYAQLWRVQQARARDEQATA